MKSNLANFLSVTILSILSITNISAQETKPSGGMRTFPMQFSIFYPISTQGYQTVDYSYNFSLNLLYGKVGGVKGLEISGLFGSAKGDVTGVQIAGLGNASNNVKGIQVGGIGNASDNVTGIQIAGIGNATDDVTGIQIAGLGNAADDVKGIQIAGIGNAADDVKGIQIGGIGNAADNVTGIQIAGIGNAADNITGLQISGVLNRAKVLKGLQIGLVSINDTIESGISLSIFNIVKKGFYDEWSLTFADYQNVGLSYKMGIQRFYTIFTAGANFLEDKLWVFGIGFGNRTVINRRFDFQPEIISYQYFPDDFKNVQTVSANHLKLGLVYKLNDRLGITVAPSVYHLYNDYSKHQDYSKISPLSPFYKHENTNRLHSIGAGISAGLILR